MSSFTDDFIRASTCLTVAVDTPTWDNFNEAWHEAEHALNMSDTPAERYMAGSLRSTIVEAARRSQVAFLPYRVTHVDVDSGDEITTGYATWREANDAIARYHRNAIPACHAR